MIRLLPFLITILTLGTNSYGQNGNVIIQVNDELVMSGIGNTYVKVNDDGTERSLGVDYVPGNFTVGQKVWEFIEKK